MGQVIVAVLSEGYIVDRATAAADRLGWSLVSLRDAQGSWVDQISQIDGARLLLLDLDAPMARGLEGCRLAQNSSDLPVLALGRRADPAWIASALRAGADCYLVKPVDQELLAAQMEALLRRRPDPGRPATITVRDLEIDLLRKKVRVRGELVPVTPGEFRLLARLATNLGKVVSSADLLRAMSGYDCTEQEAQEIVKVQVSRLRGKIDKDPGQPSYILNVRGFGYMLERRSGSQSSRE